jgi:hypothetical protein
VYDPEAWAVPLRDPDAIAPGSPTTEPDAITPGPPNTEPDTIASGPPTTESSELYRASRPLRSILLRESGPRAVNVFWGTLAVFIVLVIAWSLASGPNGLGAGFFMLILFLPGLQLAAAVVTGIILAVCPGTEKGYEFGQLGKIVVGLVLGTIVGVGLMYAMCGMMPSMLLTF